MQANKGPRPGRTGHGPPKAAATKRAGAHWPTLAQGRLARRVTSIAGREHQAPRSHRNAICRGDSRDRPAISGHLQPACAAALRPRPSFESTSASLECGRWREVRYRGGWLVAFEGRRPGADHRHRPSSACCTRRRTAESRNGNARRKSSACKPGWRSRADRAQPAARAGSRFMVWATAAIIAISA